MLNVTLEENQLVHLGKLPPSCVLSICYKLRCFLVRTTLLVQNLVSSWFEINIKCLK